MKLSVTLTQMVAGLMMERIEVKIFVIVVVKVMMGLMVVVVVVMMVAAVSIMMIRIAISKRKLCRA